MNTRIKAQDYRKLPLVYACSGCSSAAQAANYIALKLDREGDTEMSCIAGVGVGVGGNVPHSVNIAKSGRSIIAIDGCALAFTLHCLSERGLSADFHLLLNEHGVKKQYHARFDQEHADLITADIAIKAHQLC